MLGNILANVNLFFMPWHGAPIAPSPGGLSVPHRRCRAGLRQECCPCPPAGTASLPLQLHRERARIGRPLKPDGGRQRASPRR